MHSIPSSATPDSRRDADLDRQIAFTDGLIDRVVSVVRTEHGGGGGGGKHVSAVEERYP